MTAPQTYTLKVEAERYEAVFPQPQSERVLVALARALVSSPAWSTLGDAVLVVRPEPQPLLAIVGELGPAARYRVEALPGLLDDALSRLRYVDYARAEQVCERLARNLLLRFGRAQVEEFEFRGIPRGGSIVLGMLAYLLGLSPDRLRDDRGEARTLVWVDDCSLSGARFRDALDLVDARRVVFATLFSTVELRAAVERAEPRVVACVSGDDLADRAPARQGPRYRQWRRKWEERSPRAYWVGQPDHVCFPWAEPDIAFWNPETGAAESAWRVVPPELCLEHRRVPDETPAGADPAIQLQAPGVGPLRPAATLIAAAWRDRIVLIDPDEGRTLVLEESAAEFWRALVDHGRRDAIVAQLVRTYDADRHRIAADVDDFLLALRDRGLIEDGDAARTDG